MLLDWGWQAGSDSEQESNEGAGTSQKPQKRARGKVQAGTSKGSDLQTPTVAPNYGCLSLLKKKRSGGALLHPLSISKNSLVIVFKPTCWYNISYIALYYVL